MCPDVPPVTCLLLALLAGVLGALLFSQPAARTVPGPQSGDRGTLLVSGWKITPAGKQVAVDTLPMRTALSPDGRYLLVLNGGYNPPSISVLDVSERHGTVARPRAGCLAGTCVLSRAAIRVYVGGGSKGAVYEFSFANGTPLARTLAIAPAASRRKRPPWSTTRTTRLIAISSAMSPSRPMAAYSMPRLLFQDSLVDY